MSASDDMEIEPEPRCIGRCSITPSSSTEICGRRIYDNDIEYVELERGKGLACAGCVNRLLSPKRLPEEPEKDPRKFTKKTGTKAGTGARLSHGPKEK